MRKVDVGDRVSEYVLERELGRGGFGTVYLARHHAFTDRKVALKVAHDPARARLLREEGLLTDIVRHPNAVEVLGLDVDHDPPYLVMAYVDGESLADRLAREGRLRPQEALGIARDVLEALAAAHERHIVHRDLKPGNVLLGRDGRARLADFGLGRLREVEQARVQASGLLGSSAESAAALAGTLAYMAPEQLHAGKPVDERADVYAFGIVLFEMLTGARPEGGEVPSERIHGLDRRLDEVFRRCYCRLDRRYLHAGAVLADLAPLAAAGLGGAGGEAGDVPAAGEPVAALVALDGAPAPAETCLGSERVRIGSSAAAGLRVRADGVSALHAEIAFGPRGFTITDLASTAGTWLLPARAPAGKRPLDLAERVGSEPLRLAEGVTIALGDPRAPGAVRFRFRDGRPRPAAPAGAAGACARATLGPRLALFGVFLVGLGTALMLVTGRLPLALAHLGLGFSFMLTGALVRPRNRGLGGPDGHAGAQGAPAALPGRPAGVVLRAIALLFDLGLLALVLRFTAHRFLLGPIVLWLLYDALMTSAVGATAGKWLCGLRVVDTEGRLLRPGRATVRALAKLGSALPLGLGFLVASLNGARAALHDLLADTRVVQTEGLFEE